MKLPTPRETTPGASSRIALTIAFILGSSVMLLASAAGAEPDRAERLRKTTVYQGTLRNPEKDFTAVAELFQAAFEDETLQRWFDTDHDASIFAPTNEAVDAFLDGLSEDERARLFDVNNGLLANVLRFHVVPGNWHRHWVRDQNAIGSIKTISTEGHALTVSAEAEGLTSVRLRVEGAHVTRQILYENGALLGVDSVLLPPDAPEWLGCSWDTSEHDNELQLGDFTDFQYDVTGHSITNCQPWGGVTSESNATVCVKAGRHDSSGPADWFKQGLDSSMMLVTEAISDTEPAELNFAVAGNITGVSDIGGQTFECDDVRIGQGNEDATNNWWVGQPGAYNCPPSSATFNGAALGLDCANSSGMTVVLYAQPFEPGGDHLFASTVAPLGECP